MKNKENKGLFLVFVIAVIIGVIILFMPKMYKITSNISRKKIEQTTSKKQKVEKTEKITKNSKIVKELFYPNLHVNVYSKETYYKNNKFTIKDMSNNDVLANAFSEVYQGYIVNHAKNGCATVGLSFDASYIESRIKNLLNKDININLSDFNIYDNSNYLGLWKYDSVNNIYVYNGLCENNNGPKYYDLKYLVSAKKNNKKQIITKLKVAFAKVENNQYIIYNDYNYSNEIDKGVFTSVDNLNKKLKNLKVNSYQFTFEKDLCTYDNYCILKGEWINE